MCAKSVAWARLLKAIGLNSCLFLKKVELSPFPFRKTNEANNISYNGQRTQKLPDDSVRRRKGNCILHHLLKCFFHEKRFLGGQK